MILFFFLFISIPLFFSIFISLFVVKRIFIFIFFSCIARRFLIWVSSASLSSLIQWLVDCQSLLFIVFTFYFVSLHLLSQTFLFGSEVLFFFSRQNERAEEHTQKKNDGKKFMMRGFLLSKKRNTEAQHLLL